MKLRGKLKKINGDTKTVLSNMAVAFIIKGFSLILSFLMTPAFILFFGDNTVLGVWYTMLSVLSWFLNFDLGIGNGIRNNLVKSIANKDYTEAKKTISSGMVSTGIVSVFLGLVGMGLLMLLDLHKVFNVTQDVIPTNVLYLSTLMVFIAIMLRFFLTTVTSVFYAIQKSSINNFLTLVVSLLQFVFIKTAKFESAANGLFALSVAYLVISNLPVAIAGVIVFGTKLKNCRPNIKYVERHAAKQIMGIGTVFFSCQIFYMIIMNTNSFLITNQFGAEYTAEYEFYYRLTSLISMIVTLAVTPIWSMVTKAISEKKYNWLCKLYRIMKIAGFSAIAVQFLILPFEQWLMDIWLRENSITVKMPIAIAFACFGATFVYSSILSTIVCGMARMKLQAIMYGIGATCKIAIVLLASRWMVDWSIVVWSNVIVLLPYCIVQQIDLDCYLKKLREAT